MVSETLILGKGRVQFGFEATGASVATPDERWLWLQDNFKRLQALGSVLTTQHHVVVSQIEVDHVGDLFPVSVLPEVVAPEMFDDIIHRDNDAEQAVFNAPIALAASTHELFDEKPLANVIWDGDFAHELDTFDQAVLVEHAAEHPEEVIFMESLCEHYDHTVFDEVPMGNVRWDEMPASPDVHEGLVQQLDLGSEYIEHEKTKPSIDPDADDVLINIGGLSLFLEQSMDASKDAGNLWLRMQDVLERLQASLSAINTNQQRMTDQLVHASKVFDQVSRGHRFLAHQLEATTQAVLRLALSWRPKTLDVLEDGYAPALGSWGVPVETPAPPLKLGLGTSDMLFPYATEVPTNHSTEHLGIIVRGGGSTLLQHAPTVCSAPQIFVGKSREVCADQALNGMPRVNELSNGNDEEECEAVPWLQELSVALAASKLTWCGEIHLVAAQVTNNVLTDVDCSAPYCNDVVCDEDMSVQFKMHDGLLQKLTLDEDYPNDEKTKLIFELGADNILTHISGSSKFLVQMGTADHGLDLEDNLWPKEILCQDYLIDEENKLVAEATMDDVLISLHSVVPFLLDLGLDPVEEVSDKMMCDMLVWDEEADNLLTNVGIPKSALIIGSFRSTCPADPRLIIHGVACVLELVMMLRDWRCICKHINESMAYSYLMITELQMENSTRQWDPGGVKSFLTGLQKHFQQFLLMVT